MMKKNSRWVVLASSVISYATIAATVVGCENYLHESKGGVLTQPAAQSKQLKDRSAQPNPGPSASASAAPVGTISGNWLCTDSSQCAPDTVMNISEDHTEVATTSTQEIASGNAKIVCRTKSTMKLSFDNESDVTTAGHLTPNGAPEVEQSPENSTECTPDAVKAQSVAASSVGLVLDSTQNKLTVNSSANGQTTSVVYKRLSDADLVKLNAQHGQKVGSEQLVGKWMRVDAGFESDSIEFSGKPDTFNWIVTKNFPPNNQKCTIEMQNAKITLGDASHSPKGYIPFTLTLPKPAAFQNLGNSADPNDDCPALVDAKNLELDSHVTESESVTVDGTDELVFKGEHYARVK